MIQSRLNISSKDYYSCEITAKIPVQVTLLTINGLEGFGIIESLNNDENDIIRYISELAKSDNIKEIEITYKLKNEYWTRAVHQLSYSGIHETILTCGSMSIFPITIKNGIQTHNILTPTPELFSALLKNLRQQFSSVKLLSVYSKPDQRIKSILTQKQAESFVLAYESGYYNIPRNSSIEDLSKKAGIKRVAMGERLRRAEKRIFDYFISSNSQTLH